MIGNGSAVLAMPKGTLTLTLTLTQTLEPYP